MDHSFDTLKERYPGATLTFTVERFDAFLRQMQKIMRAEFERELREIQYSNGERYYSFRHVADMLDVSTRTLNRWQSLGYLVPIMVGGQRRYRKSDIERIIKREEKS